MTGNDFVDAISEMHFEGNIIPASWYQTLRFPNGKADLIAINLLSDIVYWYRATEKRDEATGALRGWQKRFKADLLQRSYQAFAEHFGLTKRQVQDACTRLAKVHGVIRLVFRTIDTPTGRLANVLFIAPVPEKIRAITHQRDRSHVQTGHLPRSNGIPPTSQRETDPEITTEITTEIPSGESAHTHAHDMRVQDQPGKPTQPTSRRMPPDYTPSATLRAELEGRYPVLDFEEEMYAIHAWEYAQPKSDWDAATRTWFRRAEAMRKEKATVPGKGNGGDWREGMTVDKRTRELMRQSNAVAAKFNAHQANEGAIAVSYEDITHDGQR
jgi:hypothetical protein